MTEAEKVPTIHERMVAILAAMPAIGKTRENTEQHFMFRGHDDVLNALNPLLAEHGVFVVPEVLERATDQRATRRGSIMYEVNLHVRYTFYGAGGDSVSASAWGEGTDMGDKSTSKAMTMAFKSVLNQAFAISSAEFSDPDAGMAEETTRPVAAAPQTPDFATREDAEAFLAAVEAAGFDPTRLRGKIEEQRAQWNGEVPADWLAQQHVNLEQAIKDKQPAATS